MAKETYPVILTKVEEFSSTVRNFHFEFQEKPRFDFIPGQFIMVGVTNPEGKLVRKSYSIASPPHFKDKIEICVKLVENGLASGWFFSLKEGDQVEVMGPLGSFKLKEPIPDELIFVGTGTGIAPLRSQFLHLLNQGHQGQIHMILGTRYENEILFQQEMQDLEKQYSNFHFIPVISRPKNWQGATGYVQNYIKAHFEEPKQRQVYICGLIPMVNAMKDTLTELGYAKEAIHFEKWT